MVAPGCILAVQGVKRLAMKWLWPYQFQVGYALTHCQESKDRDLNIRPARFQNASVSQSLCLQTSPQVY